jgi:hypothetical protein
VGCKLDNALTSNTDQPQGSGAGNLPYVTSVNPGNAQVLADDDTIKVGIQATVEITFSDYMDPTTLVDPNVKVLNTIYSTPVTGLAISYLPQARTLLVRNENWQSGSAYLVTLASSGVKNRFGTPLDGNYNGRNDGSPYDDFQATFYTSGAGPADCVPIEPPEIFAIDPDTTRVDTTLPNIQIIFRANAMDTLTLKDPASIQLTTATGTVAPLTILLVSPVSYLARPTSPLTKGQTYFVTVKCANIKANYPANTPTYLKTLDGDGNGVQATEPDYKWYFLVDTLSPPQVDSAVKIPNAVQVDFTQVMDTSSLSAASVQVFDDNGYVPGMIRKYTTYAGITRVEYYFSRPVAARLRLFVSHLVKAAAGPMLDSNGNDVGGEPTDDFDEYVY